MFRGIIGFLGILLVISVDIFDCVSILLNIGHLSIIDPFVFVLNVIHILLSVCLMVLLAMVLYVNRFGSYGIANVDKVYDRFNISYYIWGIMFASITLMESVSCFIKDDIGNGTFLLFLGIALYIFIEKNSTEGKSNIQEFLNKKVKKIRGKSV